MPFYMLMALKNVFRDKKRSFTLGINYFVISILLLLVFSITQGMKKNITESVINSSAGHITISGEYIVKGKTYQGIREYQQIRSVIKTLYPDAQVFSRYTLSSAVYSKNLSKRLSFTGIAADTDLGLRDQIDVVKGSWNDFVSKPNAVILPDGVADYFGLKISDDVLVSTRSRLGAFNTGTIQVSGIYKTGNYFLKGLVISHFDFLQKLDLSDSITATKMYVFFPDLKGVREKRERILTALNAAEFVANKPKNNNDALNAVSAASPRYKVEDENLNQIRLTLSTVDEVTGIVSQAVGAVNSLGLFVAAIILFIISISIFINMRMSINERMREIGTLRAMGSEQNDIIALFISENIFLCLGFVLAGIIAGVMVIAAFSTIITLPANGVFGLFISKGHFVMHPTVPIILFIIGILVFFTALFSYFPARYGGRISPVDALNKTT